MKKYFLLSLLVLFLFPLYTSAQTLDPIEKLEKTKMSLEKKGLKPQLVYVRTDGVSRKRVAIEKGTSLIWYNSSVFPINIAFIKYHEPWVACDLPINFQRTGMGFYKAEKIYPRDVASLCFIEPGMYFYEVTGIMPPLAGRYYYNTAYRYDYAGVVIVK